VLRAKEAYADWIVEFRNQLYIYATFTFPYSNSWSSLPKSRQPGRLKLYRYISPETALCKGRDLRYMVNVLCCGRRFREHKTGILSVIRVEVGDNRPHLHTLWEHHPLITPASLKTLWCRSLKCWSSIRAVDVQSIEDLVKVTRYTTKYLTWEVTPYLDVWRPEIPWQEDMLSLRILKHLIEGGKNGLHNFKSLPQAGVAEGCSVNGL
jgi:hypothetical protein